MRAQPGALAVCLQAWARGEDSIDAQAGAFRVAEFIHLVCEVITKKK